jgi:RNA polymerase sigma-70 factor (ECF subfamily)
MVKPDSIVESKRETAVLATSKKDAERRLRSVALVHLDSLFTYARFLLLKPAEAEDAVHECYLKAMVNIGDDTGTDAKLWLIKILRTICLREITKRGDHHFDVADDLECSTIHSSVNERPIPELPKLSGPHADTVAQSLVSSLPFPLRETIVLRECSNLSYGEIAEVTSASIFVVNARLSRARAILRHWGLASK